MKMIDDKEAYIREIQRFIIGVDSESGVVENGIYDEKSKLAVRKFKAENGLSENSDIDYETYTVLYQKYKEANIKRSRTMKRYDRGDDVLMLNMMLGTVGRGYDGFDAPPISDYFSEKTELAVLSMREIFDMGNEAYADALFYERLRVEYEIIKETEKMESER